MTRLILYTGLVFMLMVAGCSRKVTTSTSTSVTDSTYAWETTRDVIVEIPGDSVVVYQTIECDKLTNKPEPFNASAKSKRIRTDVSLDKAGHLSVKCAEDSLKEIIKAYDKRIFRYRYEQKEETKTVTEYKTRRIDIFCRWFAIIIIVLLLIRTYLKFIKPIIQ